MNDSTMWLTFEELLTLFIICYVLACTLFILYLISLLVMYVLILIDMQNHIATLITSHFSGFSVKYWALDSIRFWFVSLPVSLFVLYVLLILIITAIVYKIHYISVRCVNAAEQGNIERLKKYRFFGAHLVIDNAKVLFRACEKRQYEVVKYLVQQGSDPNAIYYHPVYYGPPDAHRCLSTAIKNKDERMVRLLLDNGANLNEYDLQNALSYNCSIGIIYLLLENGVVVDEESRNLAHGTERCIQHAIMEEYPGLQGNTLWQAIVACRFDTVKDQMRGPSDYLQTFYGRTVIEILIDADPKNVALIHEHNIPFKPTDLTGRCQALSADSQMMQYLGQKGYYPSCPKYPMDFLMRSLVLERSLARPIQYRDEQMARGVMDDLFALKTFFMQKEALPEDLVVPILSFLVCPGFITDSHHHEIKLALSQRDPHAPATVISHPQSSFSFTWIAKLFTCVPSTEPPRKNSVEYR